MSVSVRDRVARRVQQARTPAPRIGASGTTQARITEAAVVPGGWFGGWLGVSPYWWNNRGGGGAGAMSGWQQGTVNSRQGLLADDSATDITGLVLPADGVWLIVLRAWVSCGAGAYSYRYGVNNAAGQPLGADNFTLVLSQPLITQHESDVVTMVDTNALGRSFWAAISMNAPGGATYNAAMGIYALWTADSF